MECCCGGCGFTLLFNCVSASIFNPSVQVQTLVSTKPAHRIAENCLSFKWQQGTRAPGNWKWVIIVNRGLHEGVWNGRHIDNNCGGGLGNRRNLSRQPTLLLGRTEGGLCGRDRTTHAHHTQIALHCMFSCSFVMASKLRLQLLLPYSRECVSPPTSARLAPTATIPIWTLQSIYKLLHILLIQFNQLNI